MPVVEIPVAERQLAARMVAIQTWLYKKKCEPLSFKTRTGPLGTTILAVEFNKLFLAEAFRPVFDPDPGGTGRAAHRPDRPERGAGG
jgi:hypothetical protein